MKICLRKSLLPSKAFYVRRICLHSLKKKCRNYAAPPRDCVIILKPSFVMCRPNKKVKYLRQSATVTAFGHSVYDRLIANIAIIHSMFRRAVGECFTEDCVNSTFEEWPAIDAGNRYFTPKAVACSENVRSIGIDIDPFGSLNKAASSLFVHTEDNKVYYFRRRESANGESL